MSNKIYILRLKGTTSFIRAFVDRRPVLTNEPSLAREYSSITSAQASIDEHKEYQLEAVQYPLDLLDVTQMIIDANQAIVYLIAIGNAYITMLESYNVYDGVIRDFQGDISPYAYHAMFFMSVDKAWEYIMDANTDNDDEALIRQLFTVQECKVQMTPKE